jgi:hypothetical protein
LFALAALLALLTGPAGAAQGLPPGRYGLELVVATFARVPILGASRGSSVSLLLVDLQSGTDGRLRATQEVCEVEMRGAAERADIRVSDGFLGAQGRKSWTLVPGADGGFVADLGVDHVGFRPGAEDSPVPRRTTDAGVFDWDGDGRPGATILLRAPVLGDVELYVAQRAHVRLRGHALPGARAEGQVEVLRFEQHTIGSSHRLFDTSPEMWPDPASSGFTLWPAPAAAGCAGLRAAR